MSGRAGAASTDPAPTTESHAERTPTVRPNGGIAAVRALIARHDSLPIYGGTAWQALDPRDPRWLAACLRAAECWRIAGTPAAVAAQLDEDNAVMARRIRGAAWDVADAYRDRRANPPGPWPADAGVPAGFYPPAVVT